MSHQFQATDGAGLSIVIRAASFSAKKHRTQRRKDVDATPYINHPLEVMNILASVGGVNDPVVLAAAVLHDTIEDTDTEYAELQALFGREVAFLVAEVTDDKSLDKNIRKRLQIEHASQLSHKAKLIKLADKIANVRDITLTPPVDWQCARKIEYFEWAQAVCVGLRGSNGALELAFDQAIQAGLQEVQHG